jgi:hypothetical protein
MAMTVSVSRFRLNVPLCDACAHYIDVNTTMYNSTLCEYTKEKRYPVTPTHGSRAHEETFYTQRALAVADLPAQMQMVSRSSKVY